MSGFDIAAQAKKAEQEDEGTVVHIHGIDEKPMFYEEDGESKPVTITVAGAHSSKFRRIEEALRRRKIKPRQFTAELVYEDNIEKAAACTLEWEGFQQNGEPVPMTGENAKFLYRSCPWVLEQVMEAMHDHSRFFENGSTPPKLSSENQQG